MPKTTSRAADFRPITVIVPAYIAFIAAGEALAIFVNPVLGAASHASAIFILLNHYIRIAAPAPADLTNPSASYWYHEVLAVLALVPLTSLIQLTVGSRGPAGLDWYALTGLPVLVAIDAVVRLLGLTSADLGLRLPDLSPAGSRWLPQLGIGLSGLPLGLVAFLLLRPQPLLASLNWGEVALGTLILLIAVALPTEVLFRGLLQRYAVEIFGRPGLLWSSILFAALHLASRSASVVLFAGLVGLLFGWTVYRSGAIWGPVLAHGLLSSSLLLVWPHLLR